MDNKFYTSILQTMQDMKNAADYYHTRILEAESRGSHTKIELDRQKYVATANLCNMYHHLIELVEAGYSKEQALELANYHGEVNEFRAKQRGWLTMVSPEAIEILTAPQGA